MTTATPWILSGVILAAQTGIDYRRYKNGEINKTEFHKRSRSNSIASAIGVVTGSTGAAVGFAIGTAIAPGIGSAVGTLVGGIGGGLAGRRLAERYYELLEARMIAAKLKTTDTKTMKYIDNDYYEELFQEEEINKAL